MAGFFDTGHDCGDAALEPAGVRREGMRAYRAYLCTVCGVGLTREVDARPLLEAVPTRTRWKAVVDELAAVPRGLVAADDLDPLVRRWGRATVA